MTKGNVMNIDFNQNVFEAAHEDEVRAILKEEYGRYELMNMDTGETPGYLKGLRAIGEGCYLKRGALLSDDVQ
jgi:hypothetical protein